MHAVYVSLEVISAAETLSTLLTLIRPLACVSPQVFSIILFCKELLPTLLASEYNCDYFRSFVFTFYSLLVLLVSFDLQMNSLPMIY